MEIKNTTLIKQGEIALCNSKNIYTKAIGDCSFFVIKYQDGSCIASHVDTVHSEEICKQVKKLERTSPVKKITLYGNDDFPVQHEKDSTLESEITTSFTLLQPLIALCKIAAESGLKKEDFIVKSNEMYEDRVKTRPVQHISTIYNTKTDEMQVFDEPIANPLTEDPHQRGCHVMSQTEEVFSAYDPEKKKDDKELIPYDKSDDNKGCYPKYMYNKIKFIPLKLGVENKMPLPEKFSTGYKQFPHKTSDIETYLDSKNGKIFNLILNIEGKNHDYSLQIKYINELKKPGAVIGNEAISTTCCQDDSCIIF